MTIATASSICSGNGKRQRRQQMDERGDRQRRDQIHRQTARQRGATLGRAPPRRPRSRRRDPPGRPASRPSPATCRAAGRQRQRSVGHELAGRNEDYPRYREYQNQRQRKQRVDRAVGDAVLRQQYCDREIHRRSVASAARSKQKAGRGVPQPARWSVSSFAQDPLAVFDLDDDAGTVVHTVVVGRRSC